ncbi:MAG: helix-hairpin-helix domain-containing protein [Methanotrichaceae archaeon]
MKLIEISGLGVRLKDRLVAHYGTEKQALDAILKGDVASLLALKGISRRQVTSLVQQALGLKYRIDPAEFLATEEATRIYHALIKEMVEIAHTDYARLKIGTFFPSSCRYLPHHGHSACRPGPLGGGALRSDRRPDGIIYRNAGTGGGGGEVLWRADWPCRPPRADDHRHRT